MNKPMTKAFMKLLMKFEVLAEADIIGIAGMLKTEDQMLEMTDWLEKNQEATETQILRKAMELSSH